LTTRLAIQPTPEPADPKGGTAMAAQTSPVKADVLRWAVDEDGRAPDALADALKVAPAVLEAWLTGDAAPTRGQVSSLARVLQRPRALFFLPRPPAGATLPASFRHPPGDDERDVSASARRKVRQARRVQHAVSWALRDEPPVDLPLASLDDSPEEVASRVREWLGVTDEEQARWPDDRAALRAWREALEARGVLVFVLEIGRNDVRGFSAWDDRAPLIVANLSGVNPAARSFTFAHELGHLVTRKDSACVEPADGPLPDADVERWCERFGAALLMPRSGMIALAEERRIASGAADLDDVRATMRRFRVSARAAALRLIGLRLAVPTLYQEVVRVFVPAPPPPTGTPIASPPRSVARVRQYGPETLRTILSAVPPRDALSILRVTVDDVRKIADEVPGVPRY
jgi:Zn-dependent peptidase ImmA (M78 family)